MCCMFSKLLYMLHVFMAWVMGTMNRERRGWELWIVRDEDGNYELWGTRVGNMNCEGRGWELWIVRDEVGNYVWIMRDEDGNYESWGTRLGTMYESWGTKVGTMNCEGIGWELLEGRGWELWIVRYEVGNCLWIVRDEVGNYKS